MITPKKLLDQLPDRIEIGNAILAVDAERRRLRTLYRLRVKIDRDSQEPVESASRVGGDQVSSPPQKIGLVPIKSTSPKWAELVNIIADYARALLTGNQEEQIRHQSTLAEHGIFLKTALQLECELRADTKTEVSL